MKRRRDWGAIIVFLIAIILAGTGLYIMHRNAVGEKVVRVVKKSAEAAVEETKQCLKEGGQ